VLVGEYCYKMPPTGTNQYCYRTSPPHMFSNLPENVIDEILICLPFKEAVRTSVLSKQWKYNWCRLPELTLDGTIWTNTGFVRADNFDIAKFFESFISVELLHLDSDSIKFFARAGEVVPKRLPFDLNCVKRLYLSEISLNGFKVVACALCLIRSFPCLQYLKIQVDEDDADDNIWGTLKCLKVEAFSDMTLNHLKAVKLINISGTRPEMQLMKLLLAKSPALVKMVIDPHYALNGRIYVKVKAEISKFQRASSKAEVVYDVDYY
uniref:FBD-associated F-box protein At5g56690 n=1 Tax=Nicotiana tabacum TaxID=4097 RepID=A0A1S3Z2X2_TOBAC